MSLFADLLSIYNVLLHNPSVASRQLPLHKGALAAYLTDNAFFYSEDCHTRNVDWFAMTGNSTNSHLSFRQNPISKFFNIAAKRHLILYLISHILYLIISYILYFIAVRFPLSKAHSCQGLRLPIFTPFFHRFLYGFHRADTEKILVIYPKMCYNLG